MVLPTLRRPLASTADSETDAAQERLRREGLAAGSVGSNPHDPFCRSGPSVEAPAAHYSTGQQLPPVPGFPPAAPEPPRETVPYSVRVPLVGGDQDRRADVDLTT